MNDAVQKITHHPVWSIGAVVSVILLFAGGLSTANDLENQVNSNSADNTRIQEIHINDRRHTKESLARIETLLNQLISQAH